ncbi:hypothetical protein RB195_012539 [Necator americanus]|uniref:Uncharacterized protein n=1 Tax=Necator americanus TaxID=51031 RepID=A0ABR1DST4_NECAM
MMVLSLIMHSRKRRREEEEEEEEEEAVLKSDPVETLTDGLRGLYPAFSSVTKLHACESLHEHHTVNALRRRDDAKLPSDCSRWNSRGFILVVDRYQIQISR